MNDSINRALLRPAPLPDLTALHLQGVDARSFLQGQLSAEMEELRPDRALLSSCNSPQGRVQAVLWVIERSDGLALILPTSMAQMIAARLRKYVLRSKVTIGVGEGALTVGAVKGDLFASAAVLAADRSHLEDAGVSIIRLPGHSQLLVLARAPVWGDVDAGDSLIWRRDHVRAGLPQVYSESHEAFVAQMLNLDLLGGISFAKGCYTGQEIIARAHYRGAVKRRMFRFKASCSAPTPGARIVAGDQHAGDVVDAAPVDGGCELLAVVSLAQLDQQLALAGALTCALERLPLPYTPLAQ